MPKHFRLFWLRDNGRDDGTRLRAGQLEAEIRDRVLLLAPEGGCEICLPFMDRREYRARAAILSELELERDGAAIRAVLPPHAAVRDLAATLVLTDPAWLDAPAEDDPCYFSVWQSVSAALQRSLRAWIPAEYFRDLTRYEDRPIAYPMLVYAVARPFYGRPRTEFTYDLRDYPDCELTLSIAWKMVGRALQDYMAAAEQRLNDAGLPGLARRYAPVWHQDVLVAVKTKPKSFVDLLAAESMAINAVIDLATTARAAAPLCPTASINRFARAINQALRHIHGMDLRKLGVQVLEEATRVLRDMLSAQPHHGPQPDHG